MRESDPSIVVRDGRAVHMAKGRAGEQRWQSTHAGAGKGPHQSVSRSLLALRQKAAADPKHRIRSLYRMIDLPMLYECYHQLRRGAAAGVDGVEVVEYGEHLVERLADLLGRLKAQTYRPQLVRRRYIPKAGSTKMRPRDCPSSRTSWCNWPRVGYWKRSTKRTSWIAAWVIAADAGPGTRRKSSNMCSSMGASAGSWKRTSKGSSITSITTG